MVFNLTIDCDTYIGDKKVNQDIFLMKTMDKVNVIVDEDEMKMQHKPYLFIIADGHGSQDDQGKQVAEFIVNTFYQLLNIETLSINKTYLEKCFDLVDKKLQLTEIDYHKIGSTVIIGILYFINGKLKLVVCNTGDCRCVIDFKGNQMSTFDHKPEDLNEKKRFDEINQRTDLKKKLYFNHEKNGVPRIGNMAVSRSFGDKNCDPYIIFKPDIYYFTDIGQWIVFACDGLWDFYSNKAVIDTLNLMKTNNYANALISCVKQTSLRENEEMDNTTIIVIKID